MNILFYSESIAIGGQQVQTYNLIKNMSGRGHKMHWLYLCGDALVPSVEKYGKTHQIPLEFNTKDYLCRPWKLIQIMSGIRKYCKENNIDLIISGNGIGLSDAMRSIQIAHEIRNSDSKGLIGSYNPFCKDING